MSLSVSSKRAGRMKAIEDICSAHFSRAALAVEENEALDPLLISALGSQGIMFDAHHLADLGEEL